MDENLKSENRILNSDLDDINLDSNQNSLIDHIRLLEYQIHDSSNSIQNGNVDINTDIKSRFFKGCSQVVDKEFFKVCYSYDLKVAKAVYID